MGEVFEIFGALDDAGDAFETHAGVHMPRGQSGENEPSGFIKTDENEVPDLDALARRPG